MTPMKRKTKEIQGDSLLVGELPLGCILCTKGSKMVLFVTGLCDSSCYYCPISQEKSGREVVFADEMPVADEADILFEVNAIKGEGAGISGGDPLCDLERTLRYIRLLKKEYGHNFHLHLYTSQNDVSEDVLRKLHEAGLDEIRFHPQTTDWSGIQRAIEMDMLVGLEVPAIPGKQEELKRLAIRAEEMGVSFLNINELEASETNFDRLVSMGMRLTNMESASIEGSASTAREFLEWSEGGLQNLSVHFCSARFKDSVQMRGRLERRLEETIRNFEERDEQDPLLIVGVIRAVHGRQLESEQLTFIHNTLHDEFDVPADLMNLDETRWRVEVAPWVIEEISEQLKEMLVDIEGLEIGIAFEYPTWDRLQTMFNPL
ncbi:MAG: radical SAM protein [Candidatus Thorarchaeota archaeon]